MVDARRRRIGSLDSIVVDGGAAPENVIVICHGYGANQEDLAPLSSEWITLLGEHAEKYRFIFPNAPHSLEQMGMPSGRAWWPINMAKLAQLVEAAAFHELHDHEPPGIDEARSKLSDLIIASIAEVQCDTVKLALGGFSQGAMLTMDVALRGVIPVPHALLQFSGTMVCREAWEGAVRQRLAKTPVFQSHGTMDPILPYTSAEAVREMLINADISLDFHAFPGPHTIDVDSVVKSGLLLKSLSVG